MEFNSNDFSNFDFSNLNIDAFDGASGRYPHAPLSIQPVFKVTEPQEPKALLVGKWDKNTCNYLRAEGFSVNIIGFEGAFERVRWEQPALLLIEGEPESAVVTTLLKRFRQDSLTHNFKIIMVTNETAQPLEVSNTWAGVSFVQNFKELGQAVDAFLWAEKPPKNQSELLPAQVGIEDEDPLLQILLNDAELRYFVDEMIDSWTMLMVATWFAEDRRAIANVEMLVELFDLQPHAAFHAIQGLAQQGWIEPLELETPDPLFAVVAHPEKAALLQKFGQALGFQEYRLALTTWLLSRNL